MHNSKLKQITVALCMVLMPISAFAAGLGKLNVMSGLGEPLKADIELISVTPEELSSITAAIASEEAYAIQGIEKPASHNTIKVDVAKNAAGAPILKLKSAQPISEPFLDMLIQVDWASGRLLREYTVLLDPPGYTGEVDRQAAQTAQAPVVRAGENMPGENTATQNNASSDSMATAPSTVKKISKKSKAKPVAAEVTQEVMPAGDVSGQEHLTQSGDTLGKIAREMKPEGISLEQMLVGLYQANPDAFQGNNMNRLKVGQIIRPPSEEELSAISRKEASSEIKVQATDWNAYRNKLAGMVADAAPTDSEASTQSATGKIKSAAEDKSTPSATGPKDVVKLSAGDAAAAKASAENIKSLQNKITALQEEATAREKSVKEAQDRTASLEKQIEDMQKLLAMKNGAMADLQKQAEAQATTEQTATEANAVKPSAEVTNDKPMEVAPVATEPQKPEAMPAEIPKAKPAPMPEPAPEQGFLRGLLDGLDLGLLAPAGGLLALLGGGWLYLRKKREKSLADFEQGIMTSGGLKANTVFGNTASASVDTGDTSFLTDFSQSASGGMIDTNDVDPIAEAEVYMAYGRDAQAEEILKDAISKEPKRHELHLKLLEMYAASKNMSAFETISGELYTTLGAEDPTWEKVAEIGIKLEPNNPLYQAGSKPAGGNAKAAEPEAKALDDITQQDKTDDKLDADDFSDSPLAAEKDLDFSFDNDALTQGFAPTGVSNKLDVDFGKSESEDLAISAVAETTADSGMDFDLGDLNAGDLNAATEVTEQVVESFSNTMPSLDISTFQAPQFMPEAMSEATDSPAFGEMTSENIEFPQMDTHQEAGVLDISDQVAEAESSATNEFTFAVHTIQPEATSFKDTNVGEPNAFDLTTIDLELNDKADNIAEVADLEVAAPILEEPASIALEPIEVETKLDLVAAYIEMDDKEGAKELLDEVMKEGGTKQRQRAEELLAKLA